MRGGETMRQKGFTLVELLVVIAIIGILSTVAIVNLNSARDKAKFAAAQAALSQLATPMILCMDDQVGGTAIIWNNPAAGVEPCTSASVSGSDFPDLGTGWTYGTTYYHNYNTYEWGFCALHATIPDIGCDQNGCAASSTCS
jgi:prepilin-type N-terminal cleavage/methylation domain-containing protein